jgi:hypothetical protein
MRWIAMGLRINVSVSTADLRLGGSQGVAQAPFRAGMDIVGSARGARLGLG